MKRSESAAKSEAPGVRPHGKKVSLRIIRQFAMQVAETFRPDRIILFGSQARGEATADSDVDLLVVMPARNQIDQALRISETILAPFNLDILVRTPHNVAWRLKEGDSFLRDVFREGVTLYEATDSRVGPKGGGRLSSGRKARV